MGELFLSDFPDKLKKAQERLNQDNKRYKDSIERRRKLVDEASNTGVPIKEIANIMGIEVSKVYAILKMPGR
jgi:hypothetical protein